MTGLWNAIRDGLGGITPLWLEPTLWVLTVIGMATILVAKGTTVVLLVRLRYKHNLDRATIINQAALWQVALFAVVNFVVYPERGFTQRPFFMSLWLCEAWLLVAVSGVWFLAAVWHERVRPLFDKRRG